MVFNAFITPFRDRINIKMSDSDSSEILSDGEEQNTRKRHYDDEAEEVDVSDLIKGINYLRYW